MRLQDLRIHMCTYDFIIASISKYEKKVSLGILINLECVLGYETTVIESTNLFAD